MEAYAHVASIKLYKDKCDLFSNIRNILLNQRLTTNEPIINTDKWKGLHRMAFFPKDDKVSFLDTYNDSLEDSTLFKRLYDKYTG